MIEILIVIAVVKAFCSLAESKGRSKVFWGIVGAFSYYGTVLLMSLFILPVLVESGILGFINQGNAFGYALAFNLGAGIFVCAFAYCLLKALPAAMPKNPYAQQPGFKDPAYNVEPKERGSNPYS